MVFFFFFFSSPFGIVVLLWFCRLVGCVALSGWSLVEVPFGLLLLVFLLRSLICIVAGLGCAVLFCC